MSEQDGRDTGPTVVIAAAVGAVVLAAAAGLYAFSPTFGNFAEEQDQAACAVASVTRARLDDAAQGDVAAFTVLDAPVRLPETAFASRDGTATSLNDWKGRTMLLNLWATWCAPCRAEMPALAALNREMGSDEFEVVPVSVDLGEDDKPKAFYEEVGLVGLPFYHDGKMDILNALKSRGLALGLPVTVLIGKDGCALGTLNGPAEWHGEDAKALVQAAL